MDPIIVTGFIPLPGHPKSNRYLELGQRLLDLGLPTDLYTTAGVADNLVVGPNVMQRYTALNSCWVLPLAEQHKPDLPPTDNPTKDTVAFHTVQLQKSRWLAWSSQERAANTFVWIDFGILHVPGITEQVILDFYERLRGSKLDKIGMPSIWPMTPSSLIPYTRPNWFCAGGLLVMPDYLAGWFDALVTNHTEKYLFGEHSSPGRSTSGPAY